MSRFMLPVHHLRVMLVAVVAGYSLHYVNRLLSEGATFDTLLGITASVCACWMCLCILKLLKGMGDECCPTPAGDKA